MKRFLEYFTPSYYKLNFTINKKSKTFQNTTEIIGKTHSKTIKLQAVNFQINEIKFSKNPKNPVFEPANFLYDNETITIKNLPENQEITILIHCEHSLNENMQGVYLSTYKHNNKTESIIATQFESHYAREGFPCIDEPAAKAEFELKITTDDKADKILSNMPAIKKSDLTVSFEKTPKMSTYLVAFVVGHFHSVSDKTNRGIIISSYAPENQPLSALAFANEVAVKSIEYYEKTFGVNYPLKKLDQVALPDFEAGAMENWGLVTYRESMFLADKTASIETKKSVALTVAHELAHQWFGDLVTMEWWDDLWLNESFASVMEYYAVDSIYPEFNIWEDFFTGDCLAALKRDSYSHVQSVHQAVESPEEISTLFDGAIVYAKGAHLMLMLFRLLGWENFKKGIKDYFEKFAFKNTIGDNLWDCLNKYADFDVKKLMHSFIDQPGFPVIESKDNFKTFSQKFFSLDTDMKTSHFPLPKIDEDMTGHYILNLSDSQFKNRLENFANFSLEEKLRLLIDRSFVTKTPLAPSSSLIPLLEKFKSENSAAIWSILLLIINELKIFFDPDSEEEKLFKNFIKNLISEKLSEIDIKTRPKDDGNTIRLRSYLLSLSLYAEDEKVIKKLVALYNENYEALDSEIRSDILRAKLYLTPEILQTYLKVYQTSPNPELKSDLLFTITTTKDEKNLSEIIKLLKNPDIVKPQDHVHLFIYLFRNPKSRLKTFEWLEENWNYLKSLLGDKSLDYYPRYSANLIRTHSLYEEWQNFFLPLKDEPILTRAIEIGNNEISSRLKLIESDQNSVFETLKQYLNS